MALICKCFARIVKLARNQFANIRSNDHKVLSNKSELHVKQNSCWLGWAMVLGSFQYWGVLLLWHIVGQGPAVLAAGVRQVGYFSFFFISSILSSFLMPHLLGNSWTF